MLELKMIPIISGCHLGSLLYKLALIDHANLVDKQFDDTKSSRSDVFRVYPVVLLRCGAVVALVRARRRMSMVHHKRHLAAHSYLKHIS